MIPTKKGMALRGESREFDPNARTRAFSLSRFMNILYGKIQVLRDSGILNDN